jgi:hypothetical protein
MIDCEIVWSRPAQATIVPSLNRETVDKTFQRAAMYCVECDLWYHADLRLMFCTNCDKALITK